VAKVRVYELAKEFGVESKSVMDQLKEMGEFVRSASSTIEAPVVRRLKEAFASKADGPSNQGSRPKPPVSSAPRPGPAQASAPVAAAPGQASVARPRPDSDAPLRDEEIMEIQ